MQTAQQMFGIGPGEIAYVYDENKNHVFTAPVQTVNGNVMTFANDGVFTFTPNNGLDWVKNGVRFCISFGEPEEE